MRTIKILPAKLKAALYSTDADAIIAAAMSVLENAGRRSPGAKAVTVIVCKTHGDARSSIAVMLDDAGTQTIRDYVVTDPSAISAPVARQKGKKPASLLTWIGRMGGIALSELLDLSGESRTIVRPGLFRKTGVGLDDLASRLRDEGFNIPDDAVDGGVATLREMIGDELNQRCRHYTFADQERAIAAEFYAHQEAEFEGANQ